LPAWDSEEDERFMKKEIAYRRTTIPMAHESISKERLEQLVEENKFEKIVSNLETLSQGVIH
jgi:hypothetical protein